MEFRLTVPAMRRRLPTLLALLLSGFLVGCVSAPRDSTPPTGAATSGAESSETDPDSEEREATVPTASVPDDVAARPPQELYDHGVEGALMLDWEAAATWFGYAQARSPHPTTLLALGASRALAGRINDAIGAFEQFIDVYPGHPDTHIARRALERLRAGAQLDAPVPAVMANPYLQ
jgi:hypothetical protein